MTDTMKALAKMRPEEGLDLIEAPIPVAGPEDVLIKVKRASVCGTDSWMRPVRSSREANGPLAFRSSTICSANSSPM